MNIFNALNPTKQLVSLFIQDEKGKWLDISKFIPCFELEAVPPTPPEESHYEEE